MKRHRTAMKLFKKAHYWEKWWSRLACWEAYPTRLFFRTTFFSQIASNHLAMNTNWKRPRISTPIPYGNRTRVFDMKRRCPNHWTKGTKKPFFIYLSSENRSGSFCFYTQFKISFVFMLAISDVNSASRSSPSYGFPYRPCDTPTTPLPFLRS